MDTIKGVIVDSLTANQFYVINSTSDNSFFSMDNPIWYILSLLVVAGVSYLFSNRAKKNEAVTEAKKLFLDKRIEAHQKLFSLYKSGSNIHTVKNQPDKAYYMAFSSKKDFVKWFSELNTFASKNSFYFSKKVLIELSLLNNLFTRIYLLTQNNKIQTDIDMVQFGVKYYNDIYDIFSKVEDAIISFFESEIYIEYKFGKLSDEEYRKVQKRLDSYSIIKDNFKGGGELR